MIMSLVIWVQCGLVADRQMDGQTHDDSGNARMTTEIKCFS